MPEAGVTSIASRFGNAMQPYRVLIGMKKLASFLLCALLVSAPAFAGNPKKETPPGQAKKSAVPPGLAKKGGLPPGIAKKFGAKPPVIAYIAIDPRYHDRAWFLIGETWTLKKGFDASLQTEIRDSLKLPPVPPPIPLPKLNLPDPLHVISFK